MERRHIIKRVRGISNRLAESDRRGYKRYRSVVRITYLHLSSLPLLLKRSNDFRYRRALLLGLLYTNRFKKMDLSHDNSYKIVYELDRENILRNIVLATRDGLFQCVRGEITARAFSTSSQSLILDPHDEATIRQIEELIGYKVYCSSKAWTGSKTLSRGESFLCIVIGSLNFFSLLIGTGVYINRYKDLDIIELQNNSTPICLPYLSVISRWGELNAKSFSVFNSYSVGLRSYGLLENCAGDSQNSYGLTHSVQTGKKLEVIKRRAVVKTKILVPRQHPPVFSLMKRTLIYCPIPPKNRGEALSDFECFLLNLSDVIKVCQEMNIKLVVKWKREFDETLECLTGCQREKFERIINEQKDIFRVGVLEHVILDEQPAWVATSPFSSPLIEADLVLKGIEGCYYNNFRLDDAKHFSSHTSIYGPRELKKFVNERPRIQL